MLYILVVLQVVAISNIPSNPAIRYNWNTLGEFSTLETCIEASSSLVNGTLLADKPGVIRFACLKK